jgi:FkbM family methyltransferase
MDIFQTDKLIRAIKLLWQYPVDDRSQLSIISRFISWQVYKRLTHRHWDISLVSDIKLRCYPDSSSASSVIYYGLYEHSMMSFLLSYLKEDDVFFDIGANIGVYSLLAASKIKEGQIYCFEPIPKNYARIEENIGINHIENIQPYRLALYHSKGLTQMDLVDHDCMASITHNSSNKNTISVPTETLNNLIVNKNLHVTLCKLDAEGAELDILQGATHLLEKSNPPVWLLDYYTKDVADFMISYGFEFYKYDPQTSNLNKIEGNPEQEHASLAISKSYLDQVISRLSS